MYLTDTNAITNSCESSYKNRCLFVSIGSTIEVKIKEVYCVIFECYFLIKNFHILETFQFNGSISQQVTFKNKVYDIEKTK